MLYWSFFAKSFKEKYVYRFDFYISILATILSLVIQISVWKALYKNEGVRQLISLTDMLVYTLISIFLLSLTRFGVGNKIAERVTSGAIESDFTKPISFKYYLLAEDLGNNLFKALFVSLPAAIVFLIFYDLSVLPTIINLLIFIISVGLGVLIAFHIHYIVGLSAFWLHSTWYLQFYLGALFELFSGSTVPLWFYPNWLQTICDWLPFKYIFFEPISIFLGRYTLPVSLNIIGIQIFWLFVLFIIERLVWNNVERKVVVHGG